MANVVTAKATIQFADARSAFGSDMEHLRRVWDKRFGAEYIIARYQPSLYRTNVRSSPIARLLNGLRYRTKSEEEPAIALKRDKLPILAD